MPRVPGLYLNRMSKEQSRDLVNGQRIWQFTASVPGSSCDVYLDRYR